MRLRVGCELQFQVNSDSRFLFHIGVIESGIQKVVSEELHFNPELNYEDRILSGEGKRSLHLTSRQGPLSLRYEAVVDLAHEESTEEEATEILATKLPLEILPYLLPSRYCPSDELVPFAAKEFGMMVPGYSRVSAICNWIYEHLDYIPGASVSSTTATDTLVRSAGVCRDFAHLGVSFCRALNIPARYLSVYAWGLPQPDFHACFECYLGNRWYLFDASRLAPPSGFVRIGHGRDAADISFSTVYGEAELATMDTFSEVVNGPGESNPMPQWSTNPMISF